MQRPSEDRFLLTKSELESKIVVLLGGRAAEEIVFGEVSTGAADDFLKATELAREMVVRYGMSERLGVVNYDGEQANFLGGPTNIFTERKYSEQTARAIDYEVKSIMDKAYNLAQELLSCNRNLLQNIAQKLLEKETITREELEEMVQKDESAAPANNNKCSEPGQLDCITGNVKE